jgi:nicotinamide-nucleotide amidase
VSPGRDASADPTAVAVLAELRRSSETLATAESLTGGLIGELLTGVPGASASYVGGVISYATRLKESLAGVPAVTLRELGPVAERTAQEMATGVARRCAADWGLAVTGVAGPEPQDGHPVGQVFVGLAYPAGEWTRVRELRLSGSRAEIRSETAVAALALLGEALRNVRRPARR